jgi:hypothetical protein
MGIFDKALNGVGSIFGLGGGQGEYYRAGQLDNSGTKSLKDILDARNSGKVADARSTLTSGGSLSDALKGGLGTDELNQLATGPLTGSLVAQQQAMNDSLLAGLYGKGGQMEGAEAEANRLQNQGYKLQPEDYEAYGQASGNVARMFGQQEQSLAQALASRGLAAGGSGAGTAQFTGLMGNKYEQLGQMQRQIADNRMQNTMQRLQQTREVHQPARGPWPDCGAGCVFAKSKCV